MKHLFSVIFTFFSVIIASAQVVDLPKTSGGVLIPEQAAYDVRSYDLSLKLDIENQSITGSNIINSKVLSSIDNFVVDLDQAFTVTSVTMKGVSLASERKGGKIWIKLPKTVKKGKKLEIKIDYSGKPQTAVRPPWVGGFMWSKTKTGLPWIAVACQNEGADIWFPVKDHPSDEAETVSLHYTVPENLTAAGNGRLIDVVNNRNGTATYNWFVSQPINNYSITIAVAPYELVRDNVKSIDGTNIPIWFYVLPEDESNARRLIEEQKKYLVFLEKYLGPYPFRADKIGIAETPHLGMEHQSLIAYGNGFKFDKNGADWLLFHEFGHEWWANLVTAPDWNDFWIHEGFQSYMDMLYRESLSGSSVFTDTFERRVKATNNVRAVAPRNPMTTTQMYFLADGSGKSDGDIYGKGALVLHTLRYLIGDDAFFKSLRKMTYKDKRAEKRKDGKQTHFATTDDFKQIVEKESGKRLDWFFEVYVRQPKLPILNQSYANGVLTIWWENLGDMQFPMPIDVSINGIVKRVELPAGSAHVAIAEDQKYLIDPEKKVLRAIQ